MTYFLDNWGSFVGALGLAASIGGLVFAYLARRAAKSAEAAAIEARQALTRTLRLVDVQEAVDLIDRLKDRLELRDWGVVRELYSGLQSKLSDVLAALPSHQERYREIVSNAWEETKTLQNLAHNVIFEEEPDTDIRMGSIVKLNEIQQNLRAMLSNMMFFDEGAGV